MSRKLRMTMVLFFLLLFTSTSLVNLVQAEDGVIAPVTEPFQGLDLVFLIDQSGSMDGTYTGANDPNGQRIYAVH